MWGGTEGWGRRLKACNRKIAQWTRGLHRELAVDSCIFLSKNKGKVSAVRLATGGRRGGLSRVLKSLQVFVVLLILL